MVPGSFHRKVIMDKDQIAKILYYAIGCILVYYILKALLPYIELVLALWGGWYLFQEYQRNRRNRP